MSYWHQLREKEMEHAGIAELKARLSGYLKKVRAGEEVLITDRGQVVAKLGPVSSRGPEVPGHLKEMERQGLVKIGTGKIPDELPKRPRITGSYSAVQAVTDERGEDFR
jgi:prevent-host-death family protein